MLHDRSICSFIRSLVGLVVSFYHRRACDMPYEVMVVNFLVDCYFACRTFCQLKILENVCEIQLKQFYRRGLCSDPNKLLFFFSLETFWIFFVCRKFVPFSSLSLSLSLLLRSALLTASVRQPKHNKL